MGLLDFVKSAGQFKVKTRERTLVDGEVALLTETAGSLFLLQMMVGSLFPVSHTYCGLRLGEFGIIVSEEYLLLDRFDAPMKKARTRGGVDSPIAEEFVSSFVTPTSEHDYEDESISTHDNNVRTCPLSDQYFNLSSSSADTDILTFPKVAPPIPSLHADANIAGLVQSRRRGFVSALDWGGGTVPSLGTRLREVILPLWIMGGGIIVREKFEQKFLKSSEAVQQRDAKIVVLKTKLEKAENEAVGVLSGQVSGLEYVRDGLKGKVMELESECERLRGQVEGEAKLKERFVAMQDAKVQRLVDRGSALDARLSELSYQVDSKIYSHMLTAVAGRRWIIGHGLRLAFMKCCQSLDYQTALEKARLPDFCKLQLVLEQVLLGKLWRLPLLLAQRDRKGVDHRAWLLQEVATSGRMIVPWPLP
ncbi:hypothetical protein Tco_1210433 [Tanacetum coccineum]